MKLSFIVTIDPIKDVSYLNILVHSLNLQSSQEFNVIFYNQTLMTEAEVFSKLTVKPRFDYRFFRIERKLFFGNYPIWDLYSFHSFLLEQDLLSDYFMSLHMEMFLDVDYVEFVLKVLKKHLFDILFGNLTRSEIEYSSIAPILNTRTEEEYDDYTEKIGIKRAPHWSFSSNNFFTKNLSTVRENILKFVGFDFRKRLKANGKGYIQPLWYAAEDVYFMKKEFARQSNWFLPEHSMFFEDVHICQIPGVCELGREIKKITRFPVYFNIRKIYHISHYKYYFQLEDDEFTEKMLNYDTQEPILLALKEAIRLYRAGNMSMSQALNYTRRNSTGTGTQNLNYKYHMMYLRNRNL